MYSINNTDWKNKIQRVYWNMKYIAATQSCNVSKLYLFYVNLKFYYLKVLYLCMLGLNKAKIKGITVVLITCLDHNSS